MTDQAVSPLRRRIIEDMTIRKFTPKTQHDYVQRVENFALPAPIADIAYQNKALIYDLLLKVSAETLITIAADPKDLGARIGITCVRHTWGSALTHHPHAHMIVPGGGITPLGRHPKPFTTTEVAGARL